MRILATFAGLAALIGTIGLFLALGLATGNKNVAVALAVVGFFPGMVAFLFLLVLLYPKRHIRFYADDTQREVLLEVLQDKKFMPINARYTVIDPDGRVLARFRKNYIYNFFRRRWYIYYPDGELMAMALEDSLALSLLRRFFGYWITMFLMTNFIITRRDTDIVLGEFNRKFTLLDSYVLDMSPDRRNYIDRRIAIALGVMLDTGEHR